MTYQQSVGPYFSTITVTNISKSFAYKMAAKINWHRYGTIITLLSPYAYNNNIWQSCKQERDCLLHFLRLLAVCWSGAQSARDNHAVACNFAKYAPIYTSSHSQTQQ